MSKNQSTIYAPAAQSGHHPETTLTTSAENLDTALITITAQDGKALPVYYAHPSNKKHFPVILVVQEIFGVHEYIRDICRRLAHQGYFALAPELYFRQGNPAEFETIAQILEQIVSHVSDSQIIKDLDCCLDWAIQHNSGSSSQVGITGFCWGGRIAWLYAAHNPRLKAAVAWYGKLDGPHTDLTPAWPIDITAQLKVPVLGLYGGQDDSIPLQHVDKMQQQLHRYHCPSEIIIYPDAPHAFHADYRPTYHEQAAKEGWQQMLKWFKKHGL